MAVYIKKAVEVALAQRGMNKGELAASIGIHQGTVSNTLAGGNVTLRVLELYAKAMNMPVWELIKLGEE